MCVCIVILYSECVCVCVYNMSGGCSSEAGGGYRRVRADGVAGEWGRRWEIGQTGVEDREG